jgi:hydrocephalus-inducing protein
MDDARRPFTPQIQPISSDPYSSTPEQSLSPRSRGTKKSLTDSTSASPTRKPNQKDSNSTNSNKKDQSWKTKNKNKDNNNLEDTLKSTKSTNSRKSKEKSSSNNQQQQQHDPNEDTSSSLKLDSAIKSLTQNMDDFNPDRPDSQAAQMRAESSLSHHAPSTIAESGYVPFSVETVFGRIEAGKTQTFKVKFSPLNVNDYQAKLICQIPNTEDDKLGHMILVKGRGLLPYCHFELEESDYITSGRRNPELPGPSGSAPGLGLDPMTKVIEFKSNGLANKIAKKFEIINPTSVDYDFEWIREESIQNDSQFTCVQLRGCLLSGKKYEIQFEFDPNEFGIHESYWRFIIPKYDLSVPFLLVGIVNDLRVMFDRSHVLFKSLLTGRTGRELVHILNQESKEIEFEIDQTSCYSEARAEVVLVDPARGILKPNSKFPIELTFSPKEQRQSVFNIKCKLNQSNKPLNLNVKGEGFSMQTSLFCEDTLSGAKIEFSDSSMNEIHMGQVEKNEICYRNLYVVNNGKHRANFEWTLTSQYEDALDCFQIEPAHMDSVEPGEKKHCILKYVAKLEKSTISNLILKIENGSVYHVHLDGIAVRPDLQIDPSSGALDFGPTFVYKAGMKIKTLPLTLTNRGSKDLNISCINEIPPNSPFQFEFKQLILGPEKSVTTQCSFMPKDYKSYTEKLVFELNGLTKREVILSGQGTALRIELADPKQKLFDLGTLQTIGSNNNSSKKSAESVKKLQIVNKSQIDVLFNILFEIKNDFLLMSNYSILSIISPTRDIYLKSNQTFDLEFKFSPKRRQRIPKFTEDVSIECNGLTLPLCSVQGACHGYNIWLESSTLPFGAVVQKSSVVKRITLHNDGDIGASFKWDVEKMRPEFSIHPSYGYISSGMEVTFNVAFSPSGDLSPDIRKPNIKCFVEGLEQPLTLTMSGSCVQCVPQRETHHFEAFVRHKDSKTIQITNRTNAVWELRPLVEGEYFTGSEVFIVEPQSTGQYEITYSPMTMTNSSGATVGSTVMSNTDQSSSKKHTGSVFFPLPDGTALLYNLTGTSNPPKPLAKIQREVPCKTQYTEILNVENWLKKPQRFKVIHEINRPERSVENSIVIKGHDYIDIPGNGKKEYKLSFFAHKEGVTLLRVVFKNEQTNEFCYYELGFKAIKGASLGTIDLITQVRATVSHSIKLDNPLANMVTFNASCTNAMEVLIPTSLAVTGKGQADFNFEFLPLKAGEQTARLELVSSDLGTCVYDLNLKALPPANERPVYFKTSFGTAQTLQVKFNNFCRQKTDYICKVIDILVFSY